MEWKKAIKYTFIMDLSNDIYNNKDVLKQTKTISHVLIYLRINKNYITFLFI